MFRAYDKKTGAVVGEIELPSKTTGAPMTYMHKGKQYIVVPVSTREHPAELVALALADRGKKARAASNLASPASTSTPTESARSGVPPAPVVAGTNVSNGRTVFTTYCAACHGANGEGVEGTAPPVSAVTDPERVAQIISRGGVQMPPMQTILTPEQIRDVSAFVVAGLPR